MRHILLLIISIVFLAGCDTAKFETGGDAAGSKGDANGFEVVADDTNTDQDTVDDGTGGDTGDQGCVGDSCDDDSGDDSCTDCSDDDDDDDNCTDCDDDDDHDGHADRDGDGKCDDKDHDDDTVTPDEVFDDKHIQQAHDCSDQTLKEHKVDICKWPSGDESKEHTICVAKASLANSVGDPRRQDRYFVGVCPSDSAE